MNKPILIILVVFVILAKHYKLRVRENEVNIYMIVEEHYERYIEQEVEYRKEITGLVFLLTQVQDMYYLTTE